MNKRLLLGVFAIAVLVGGYYYASPYWVLHRMQSAARAGEGDRLAAFVDFPAVRESVKSQVMASMAKSMENETKKDNPFAAFGMMLAGTMANSMVDAMVTPDAIVIMVNKGTATQAAGPKQPEALPPAPDSATATKPLPRVVRHYEGLDVFHVELQDPDTKQPMLQLVMNREGWFGWKLKAVRMPALLDK